MWANQDANAMKSNICGDHTSLIHKDHYFMHLWPITFTFNSVLISKTCFLDCCLCSQCLYRIQGYLYRSVLHGKQSTWVMWRWQAKRCQPSIKKPLKYSTAISPTIKWSIILIQQLFNCAWTKMDIYLFIVSWLFWSF